MELESNYSLEYQYECGISKIMLNYTKHHINYCPEYALKMTTFHQTAHLNP